MRHGKVGKKLGRTASHRKALLANLAMSLVEHKRIKTTLLKAKEIEMLVVKLAKSGNPPSMIGTILRDSYGIPDTKLITKKKVSQILSERELLGAIPEDLMALIKKSIGLKKHMEDNRQDMGAKRGYQLTESKIRRLIKYYKQSRKLPADWKYDPKRIALLLD